MPELGGGWLQEVYEQLKAREEKVRRSEAQLAEAEAEGLRRLRAREEGIEASISAREARLAQQVCCCPSCGSSSLQRLQPGGSNMVLALAEADRTGSALTMATWPAG